MEDMVDTFWRGKKVFLTGHTGFKGSWLSLWLEALGASVMGYALDAPTTPSLFESARVSPGMLSAHGDVRDLEKLRAAITGFEPEIVFHLAAQPLVRLSYQDPIGTYQTNVLGTANLLESLRACASVRAVVVATSDKCYENTGLTRGYRETDPLGGHDPYSSSKACAELVAESYRKSFFFAPDSRIALATARAGNVIGGGDWAADRLVPDLMQGFAAGHSIHIRNPLATRPWQHVLEPLRGYLMLAEALFERGARFSGAWNFGPGHADVKPVGWIVDKLAEAWGEGARWQVDTGSHPHEAFALQLDCTKAAAELGWIPALDLTEALAMTLDWYRCYFRGDDVRAKCLAQISEYTVKQAGDH